MKLFFISPLIICFLFIGFCKGQECKCITKLKSPTFAIYVGIINIPPDYNNTTSNKFFTLDLAKYVRSDTSFVLGLEIESFDASKNLNLATVILQFEDNTTIVKSDQPLHIAPMTGGRAILSTKVRLALNEVLAIKNKFLVRITLADSKVVVPEIVSKSLKEVAGCLPNFW